MRLEMSDVAVASVVDDVVELYENVAEDKHIEVSTNVESGLTVPADARRLRQVLANLIDNAIKYTQSGGRVSVSARREGALVRFDISDTGVGIPPHDLPHIWDRLYRADASRSAAGGERPDGAAPPGPRARRRPGARPCGARALTVGHGRQVP